ncbi:MAG: dUTP diphosphatase [Patescibacteria group bacterium]|nr:dUTP diphosphatase [Patescibacteria group bacterium]
MKIKITRLRDDVEIPNYQTDGAAAFDLASAEEVEVPPKTLKLVPTGLVIGTPPGHVLILASRSSLFKKKGLVLANGIGVVDSDYAGPDDQIFLAVYNQLEIEVKIEAGERIAQGMIMPVVRAEFEEGETSEKSRGGFGSTG